MADHQESGAGAASETVSTDRGLFDFMKKKEEKPQDQGAIASEFEEKVKVSETECKKEEEEKKEHGGGSLLEKLHRSDSSSSSSSDEEGLDEEEKKKRKEKKKEKKGLKEKIKEKFDHKDDQDVNVPIEKCDDQQKIHVQEVVYSEPSHAVAPPPPQEQDHEKKGFLDKIKEKLPGQQKKADDHDVVGPTSPAAAEPCAEGAEKKGFLDKIKEKIPGFHSKNGEEEKKEEKKESHE